MYVLDPDFRYQSDSAHDSAAANVVFTFFRGTKIRASWYLVTFVPRFIIPTTLYIMNLWNGSSRNGFPRSGVPSMASPCWWHNVFSMIPIQNSGPFGSSSYFGFFRSEKKRSAACFRSIFATILPSRIPSAYSITVLKFLASKTLQCLHQS